MLSLREQLANGIFESTTKSSVEIPKKAPSLGAITEDGYCDYEVAEDVEYLTKDMARNERLHKSRMARKHRKEVKKIRFGQ